MAPISVVIIAKNESKNIVDCIASARLLTNDIIVADSGSVDGSQQAAIAVGAKVVAIAWKGYGAARNEAAAFAVNDWVFSLDADERLTSPLVEAIEKEMLEQGWIYGCKRESFLVDKKICFGEWGRDKVYRLYNRNNTSWNLADVHENIIATKQQKKLLHGALLHFTATSQHDFFEKTIVYAKLSAEKYFHDKKKATIAKLAFSAPFSFMQNYIFRLGFLDGKEGYWIAKNSAKYIQLKYGYLRQLYQQRQAK